MCLCDWCFLWGCNILFLFSYLNISTIFQRNWLFLLYLPLFPFSLGPLSIFYTSPYAVSFSWVFYFIPLPLAISQIYCFNSLLCLPHLLLPSNKRARWKVLGLAYNQSETRNKQLLGRDPDRSWCHCHISVQLSWSQPMDPWTEWQHILMPPISMEWWALTKKFTLVWWHQLLSGSLPNSHLSWVSHRL